MALQGTLQVMQGFLRDKIHALPLDKEYTIGRDRKCDIPIMSRRVSRHHATIGFRNGAYSITDLNSKTGTQLNSRKITMSVLRDGDIIQIADVKFRFVMSEPEAAPAPAPASRAPVMIPPKPAPPLPPPEKKAPQEVELAAFAPEELAYLGRTIGGVKLIAALGKGRRTVIYKGIHSAQNLVVAFKMLSPEVAKDPAVVRWFIAGAKRSGNLRHEDAVWPIGGGSKGSIFFVYTTFMENGTAQERFATAVEEGTPAVKRALETLVHVTRALEFGLKKGVLHLGIRPSKILYDEKRHAKLSGLGFDNTLSAPGAKMTPEIEAYLAPEQAGTNGDTTAATDVYSLGAAFYFMLTGQPPLRDRRQRLPSPKGANRAVPDSICRIIEKMVVPSPPGARYRTYGQLLHDLRWALRGEAWPHA